MANALANEFQWQMRSNILCILHFKNMYIAIKKWRAACILHQIINSKSVKQVNTPRRTHGAPLSCLLQPACCCLLCATAAAAFVCFSHVTSLTFAPVVPSYLLPSQLSLIHCIYGSHHCLMSVAAVLAAAVIPASSPLVAAAICYPSLPFPRVHFCCFSSPLSLWSLDFHHPPEHCSPRSIDNAPHHVTFLHYFLGNTFS